MAEVGDIISYQRDGIKRYGLVVSRPESKPHYNNYLVWAKWAWSLEDLEDGVFDYDGKPKFVSPFNTAITIEGTTNYKEEDLWE